MSTDQRGGDVFGAAFAEQARGQFAVLLVELGRFEQSGDQAFAVVLADILGRGHLAPFGLDSRAAQHRFDPLAARIGDHDHRGALFARAARPPRAVLERFGVARDFDVDHQAERRQVDPAGGNVGRDANSRAAIAQRLQRVVALGLAVLARKRHGGKTALDQRRVQVPDIVARGAEQHRRFGLVKAQQVDHRVLDLGRGDGDRLVGDIAVAAILAHGRDPQRIALVPPGQGHNRLGHGRRKQQRAAA